MKREDFMWAAKLNTLEMIKSGTTNFADSHFIHIDKQSIDNIVKGVLKTGIRATIVRSTQNRYQPEEFLEDIGTAKRETRRVYDQYNGAEGRITVVPEILTVIEADEEFIIEMKALALELGNGLHMHVAEHWDEYVYIKNKISSGLGEIEYIDKLGLLNDKFLMAHVVWATPKEILLIKKADAKVAHNAVTNQRGNDGVAPVPLMRTLGITVGIGCDGASSNNDQDMIKAMKMCAMMHKLHNCNSAIIDAEDVVEMATIDGARALRMGDKVGSIEMGKKADLIVIDLKKPHLTPCARPISNLVYSANGSDVVTTIVDGKIIMENRVVKTVDEEEIIEKASSITKRLVEESGINVFAARDRFKVC
jgi:5-methylthioadenosine/S-adenosylhomocysteine deaminase